MKSFVLIVAFALTSLLSLPVRKYHMADDDLKASHDLHYVADPSYYMHMHPLGY